MMTEARLVCGGIPLHLLDVLIEASIVAARGILGDEHRHTVHLLFTTSGL